MPYLINKTKVGFKNGDHYIGVDAFVDQTVAERMAEINRIFADLVGEYNTAIDNYTTQGDKFLNGDPDAAAGTTERDGFIQTINAKIAEGTAYENSLEETLTNTEARIDNKVEGAESRIDGYIDQELLPNFTDITQITNMINDGFNPNHDYKAGDFIIYTTTNASNQTESKLYKFITDHPAGEWIGPEESNTDVIEITFGEEVEDLKNNLVLASDTEPTYSDNRIWLNESKSTEYEVPTWEEFEELSENTIEKTLSPTLKEIYYSSNDIEPYKSGLCQLNGVFKAEGSNSEQYFTYLYHFTEDCEFYIERTSPEGSGATSSSYVFNVVLYNTYLGEDKLLPIDADNAATILVASGRYNNNDQPLPSNDNRWQAKRGYTLAISRREWTANDHSTTVTDANLSKYTIFSTYNNIHFSNKASLNTNHINQILNNNEIVNLKNEIYGERTTVATTGTIIPLIGQKPKDVTFTEANLTTVHSANRFNISAVNFSKSSSASNPTITKTTTGVTIESDAADNTAGSNRYIYFNYTAEATGKLWISCQAKAATHETRDCRMLVRINGVEKTPHLVGEGEQKRSYMVNIGDTVQVRLFYHLYTSTAINTVTYSNIMIAYDDLDNYIPYTNDVAVKEYYSQGDILVFDNTASVSYTQLNDTKKFKCVCFGDSITGMFDSGDDYPSMATKLSNIECINVGFSGSRWTNHSNANFKPFSINQLIDAIVSRDFSTQDAAVGNVTSEYYAEHLAALEAIDFNTIDCVTFLAGTNDWGFNALVTSESDSATENKQWTNIEDAVKYSIQTLLDAYPHLSILILTPYWRNIRDNEDSDVTPNEAGIYLYEVAEVIEECAKECNVACENLYHSLGASMRTRYYWTIDGTHPTVRTRQAIAKRIINWIDISGIK